MAACSNKQILLAGSISGVRAGWPNQQLEFCMAVHSLLYMRDPVFNEGDSQHPVLAVLSGCSKGVFPLLLLPLHRHLSGSM